MVSLILAISVAGFLCWLVLQIPMPPVFRQVLIGLMVLGLILYVLAGFGYLPAHWHWRG